MFGFDPAIDCDKLYESLGLADELRKKFAPKKILSLYVSGLLRELGYVNRSIRMAACGDSLDFIQTIDENGELSGDRYLVKANFCRDRACPVCAWRRQLVLHHRLGEIFDFLAQPSEGEPELDYIFVTLTVPSCPSCELRATLLRMARSWRKLYATKAFRAFQGYVLAKEVTYNEKTDLYHPHFHIICAVRHSYFQRRSREFLTEKKLLLDWQKYYNDQTITQVKIQAVSGSTADQLSELIKYPFKATDFCSGSHDRDISVLSTLLDQLSHLRFVQLQGCFRSAAQELRIDSAALDDGDLVHVGNVDLSGASALMMHRVQWTGIDFRICSYVVPVCDAAAFCEAVGLRYCRGSP